MSPKLRTPVTKEDHSLGPKKATREIVEYGDYECGYCGLAYQVIKAVLADAGDTTRFVFRNFPLAQAHPNALDAAEAAEAGGRQGKFWEMHDLLFENQSRLDPPAIIDYASRLHLDLDQFVADLEDDTLLARIDNDLVSGARSGVNGTPCFFIDGIRYEGELSYEGLMQALEQKKQKRVA